VVEVVVEVVRWWYLKALFVNVVVVHGFLVVENVYQAAE
jgi:hypothetical protein